MIATQGSWPIKDGKDFSLRDRGNYLPMRSAGAVGQPARALRRIATLSGGAISQSHRAPCRNFVATLHQLHVMETRMMVIQRGGFQRDCPSASGGLAGLSLLH